MESKHRKDFAVVIMAMVAVMLCSLVCWPTNMSLPHQVTVPFTPSHTLSMFLLCNTIILAVILTTHFGSPRNSNGVTTYDDRHHVFLSPESFCEQEKHNSEDHQPTEQVKFIYSAEDTGAEERYGPVKSEKMGCRDIVNYTENCQVDDKFICSSVTHEPMKLVEVPAVIDSQYSELASMIDGDFNRAVEEFITEFKHQLRLQRQ